MATFPAKPPSVLFLMQLQQSKQMDIPKFTCAPAQAFSFIFFGGRVLLEKIHTTELAEIDRVFKCFFTCNKLIGAAPRWHLFWGGRVPFGKKGSYAPRATDFREERNPPQADSIVSVLIDSKLCTIQYCNITILLQYCTIL